MPGSACHFETADLPHVNESGSGGRVTGRGCLFAPAANAWVQTSLRLSFGSSPLNFFPLVCATSELRSCLVGDLSPIASYKTVWILKAAE